MLITSKRAMLAASAVFVALPSVAARRSSEPATPMAPKAYSTGLYHHEVDSMLAVCREAGIDAEAYRDVFVANDSGSYARSERALPWISYDEEANASAAHQDATRREHATRRLQWLATRYDEPGRIRAGCEALVGHASELATADVFTARFPVAWEDIPSSPKDEGDQCIEPLRVTAPAYPPAAVRRREHGTALVGVTLDSDGNIAASEIAISSGSPWLDRASLSQSALWQFDVSTCLRSHNRNLRMVWVPLTFSPPY